MYQKNQKLYSFILLTTLFTFILTSLIPTHPITASNTQSILSPSSCGMSDIVTITYDEESDEIYIIGETIADETFFTETYIRDNLIIAIRGVRRISELPGVTLEPEPGLEGFHKMYYIPDDLLRNIHFGTMLAKADVGLKTYGLGVHNETEQPIVSTVPNYKSIVERLGDLDWQPSGDPVSWRIFIELVPQLMITTDGRNDIRFQADQVVQVNWAFEGSSFDPVVQQAVQGWVDHFNQNYDLLAADYRNIDNGNPSLQETVELGKLVAIANWLEDKDIPLSLSGDALHEVPFEQSPDLVPIIDVPIPVVIAANKAHQFTWPDSPAPFTLYTFVNRDESIDDETLTTTTIVQGGVDFSGANTYTNDDTGNVQQLATNARNARPNDDPPCYSFSLPLALNNDNSTLDEPASTTATYTALVIPLSSALARVSLPLVLNDYPATATWQVNNLTGGSLQADLSGFGTHIFPTGTTAWENITPGTYNFLITSLGGPCAGATIPGTITLPPGGTVISEYTCTTNFIQENSLSLNGN